MIDSLDPDTIRAQRMAELQDLAEYRARRLKAYQEWALAEKRCEIQAKAIEEEMVARKAVEGKTVYLPARLKLDDLVTVVELHKGKPKRSWWARLFGRS